MNKHRIVLFGPQGSGKGTQGEKLADFLRIPLVITGNIFRQNIKEQTELGKLVSSYINRGELVPNSLTIKMISDRLHQQDCLNGFVLDGFPRSTAQAEALNQVIELTHVILINISDEQAIHRIASRRSCLKCGSVYHLEYKKPKKDNLCDRCQLPLVQREDDTIAALQKRLKIYHKETEPLLAQYEKENILFKINGEQMIEKVWQDVKKIFV